MSNEVANTILKQLAQAGNPLSRLTVMVGAHTFTSFDNGVSFRFKARAANGANALRIVLEPNDTYKVTFLSVRAGNCKVKSELSDVYAEDLKRIFESTTKLYLSLR